MRRLTIAVCTTLLLRVPQAMAADDYQQFQKGVGVAADRCTTFIEQKRAIGDLNAFSSELNGPWWSYIAFIQGYRTAFNEKQPGTYDLLPDEKMPFYLSWLEQWCSLFPRNTFADAVIALAQSQYADRIKNDTRFNRQ